MQNQGFIIAREGFPWIFLGLLLTTLLIALKLSILTFLSLGLTAFMAYFFRNPKRNIPQSNNLILSPADGTICQISDCEEKKFLKEPRKRVSIFMSVFNCHVNRSPIEANIIDTQYNRGKFHFANVDKASELNEQHSILLEDKEKNQFVVVQIAGFIARRIKSYVKKGDSILAGEPFGIIQFGSRVDIYLPKGASLKAALGQKVKAGETVIGEIL